MNLFLTSEDYIDFLIIRKIYNFDKILIENRNVLKVKVDIPIIGQKYNLGDYDPDILYLINRHDENAFDKLNKFPIHVHVLIIKTREKIVPTCLDDLYHIAWASLYNNKKDAYNHKMI